MNQQPTFDWLVQIATIRQRVADTFMSRQNVVACGIGIKISNGQSTGIPSVVVSVTHKEPQSHLTETDLIPSEIAGIKTDVIETGTLTPLSLVRTSRVRPIQPGISIGHEQGTAGTLGCIVKRNDQLFLLSNNHVFAILNAASPGDVILQPGPADGGTSQDAVGELVGYATIQFLDNSAIPIPEPSTQPQGCATLLARLLGTNQSPQTGLTPQQPVSNSENRVDAAIARILPGTPLDPTLAELGDVPTGVAEPRLGMQVFKSGRTTGVTQGLVTQVDVTVEVDYGSKKARYVNQIMTTPFTQRGDSGSLMINSQRQAVGLIFSGSDLVSIANPMRFVLAALRVDLATE